MVRIIQTGTYRLYATGTKTNILDLDGRLYSWSKLGDAPDSLRITHRSSSVQQILATGSYRLYEVEDEPRFSPSQHLELNVGPKLWQGYLLAVGLPVHPNTQTPIAVTSQTISAPEAKMASSTLIGVSAAPHKESFLERLSEFGETIGQRIKHPKFIVGELGERSDKR
jgi:hypothetical protein